MRVKWENILALGFLALIVFLLVGGGVHVQALMTDALRTASWDPHSRVQGLMALGFILISIVAIVKIIVSRPK